jgi:hypothetical protein
MVSLPAATRRSGSDASRRGQNDLILVGQFPYLAGLAGLLLRAAADRSVVIFRHGGLVGLERADTGGWCRWCSRPRARRCWRDDVDSRAATGTGGTPHDNDVAAETLATLRPVYGSPATSGPCRCWRAS